MEDYDVFESIMEGLNEALEDVKSPNGIHPRREVIIAPTADLG